jgi:hypothetical protein
LSFPTLCQLCSWDLLHLPYTGLSESVTSVLSLQIDSHSLHLLWSTICGLSHHAISFLGTCYHCHFLRSPIIQRSWKRHLRSNSMLKPKCWCSLMTRYHSGCVILLTLFVFFGKAVHKSAQSYEYLYPASSSCPNVLEVMFHGQFNARNRMLLSGCQSLSACSAVSPCPL